MPTYWYISPVIKNWSWIRDFHLEVSLTLCW